MHGMEDEMETVDGDGGDGDMVDLYGMRMEIWRECFSVVS